MRDAAPDLKSANAVVYGISRDSVAKQAQFHEREKLNFTLLSDADGSVVGKYGSAYAKRPFSRRWTFVLDKKGVVRHVLRKVNVRNHGAELVETLARLKKEQAIREEAKKLPKIDKIPDENIRR